MTLFFLLVLIGNYARGGGGPSTKFYCWHVLTYFYKKIFRRELVISFCPVGTSIFSIMAEFGNVGSGFGWTSLCKTGWDENAGGQLASEMMATSDDQPVCRYTHCWDIAGIILRLCNMLMTLLVYAVCTLPDISGIIPGTDGCCRARAGWYFGQELDLIAPTFFGPSKVGKTSTSTDLGIAQWATGFALLARYDWAEMFSYEYISTLLCTCKVGGASVTLLTCSQVQADKQTGNLKAATYLILC